VGQQQYVAGLQAHCSLARTIDQAFAMHHNVKIGPPRLRGIVPRFPVVAEAADILKLRADAQQRREAAERIIDPRLRHAASPVRQAIVELPVSRVGQERLDGLAPRRNSALQARNRREGSRKTSKLNVFEHKPFQAQSSRADRTT
jgi:hypothetical protein